MPDKQIFKRAFKKYQSWFGILISVFFLYLIIRQISPNQFFQTFSQISYFPLLPAIIIYFGGVYFRALRWRYLLKPVKDISILLSFKVISIGYMANNILPLRAGEFYRAHLLGLREGISRTAVFSSIVLERVFDGLSMLVFLAVLSLIIGLPLPGWAHTVAYLSFAIFISLITFFILLVMFPEKISQIITNILRLFPEKLANPLNKFLMNSIEGLKSLQGIKSILIVLLLSLSAWLFEAGMYYFLFFSYKLGINYFAALLLVALINLGILIPSAPGYVGPFEFFCTKTLAIFSISASTAFSYSVLLHFALFLPITLLGLYYFFMLRQS